MAESGTLIVDTVDEEQKFVYQHTIAEAGEHAVNFNTKNTFLDKDIYVEIETPEAATPTLDISDITGNIAMGEANDGYYEPTATISGNVSVSTAGWITTGDKAVSEAGVKIGKVAQSTLANGNTPINSGAEITPAMAEQTINITEGYNTARTVVVKSIEDADPATVVSGNATIDSVTYTPDDTNHKVTISGSEAIPAPSVSTAGFISSTKGTKTAGVADVDVEVDQITVGVTVTGTAKVTPVIARTVKPAGEAWVDAAAGSVETTTPSSGAYVQVDAAALTSTISAVGKVTAAGYGTADHYQADVATDTVVGTNAADTAYVPIKAGTVTSATAEISTISTAYNSTSGKFDITGSASIPAPTVSTAGYVGDGVGTLTAAADGATVAASVNKIGIAASLSGTGTTTPVIATNAAGNVEAAAATTTQPVSGYYVAVSSPANTTTVHATASVVSEGYGTSTEGQYTSTDSSDLTVGAAASDVTYVPLTSASLANAATSGEDYYDWSETGPVLISGSYLYINEGYVPNAKISLARLVPDAASANLADNHILGGYSAYNNDGTLITGTIPTYTGSYTVA